MRSSGALCSSCRRSKKVSSAGGSAQAPVPGQVAPRAVRPTQAPATSGRPATARLAGHTRLVEGHTFVHVGPLVPTRAADGKVQQFLPQGGYRNTGGVALHAFGSGPFCRFRIDDTLLLEGVYLLETGGETVYIGECLNLASRFNSGYGQISPRNCYSGGQSTNCRINALVLQVATSSSIDLWFLPTTDRKGVELELIRALAPRWNLKGR